MRQELGNVDWNAELQPMPIADCWRIFKQKIQDIEKRYIPIKTSKKSHHRKPMWLTHRAIQSVRRKHRVYKKYKKTDHPAYIAATKRANTELKKAKINFETKLASNIKEDKKSFYAYVRSKCKARVRIGSIVNKNGEEIEDLTETAEEFNEYFSSVFTEEDTSNVPCADQIFAGSEDEMLQDLVVAESIVKEKLSKLRSDKATGADDLSPRVLKELIEELITPIIILTRKSLDEGSVPEDWKIANVCPVFKRGSRNRAENYRPVSLTSQISKIIESMMRDEIVGHLEKYKLIKESQHGFRRRRSCLTNLLVFLDKVT